MKQGEFSLLGYDNPLGRYPAPVVPIGRLGDELVAVYAGGESTSYITLEDDAQYLEFDAGTLRQFVDFDPRFNRLFATSSSEVRRYLIKDEQKVFSKLLKQESFSYDNPFLRLSLAKVTNNSGLIVWELTSCVLWMLKSTPELVESWYRGQLQSLKASLPYLILVTIPYDWRDLPAAFKSWKGRRMWTFSELEQEYRAMSTWLYSFSERVFLVVWTLVFAFIWMHYLEEETVDGFLILAGIVLTHLLFFYHQLYRESQGYMLRAARNIWFFLFWFFTIQWVIGSLCFYWARTLLWPSAPKSLFAFITGVMVVAIPAILESILLPKGRTTVNTLRIRLTILLGRLHLVLRPYFAWAIAYCIAQDFFACEKPNAWGLNLSPAVVGDRLRMLYEFYKHQIAEERNDPLLLQEDVSGTPWYMFYLLVRHVGRNRLREYLKNPAALSAERDGRERS